MESRRLVTEERWSENEELLQREIEGFPNDPELHLRLAVALSVGNPEESKGLLRKAVELSGNDPQLLTRAASLAFDHQEIEDARTWTKRALELAPPDFALTGPLIHSAGKLAWLKGNLELAERYLIGSFEEAPEVIGHAEVLAAFHSALGRKAKALRVIDEATRVRGDVRGLKEARDRILLGHPD